MKNVLNQVHTLILKLEPYLAKKTYRQLSPYERLKRSYGIIKLHKPGHPLRPIVSSINTVTSPLEQYLLKLIAPLTNECQFGIKSLFTSINVERTVNYVLDKIYKNPNTYFTEIEHDYENPENNKKNFP